MDPAGGRVLSPAQPGIAEDKAEACSKSGAQTRSKEAGREGTPPLNHSLPIAPWSSSQTAAGSLSARSTTTGHPGNPTLS
ncbi:hypothetical protein NDU88_001011 [Pleurodeles waltl]|uniref:Uncharacterized protein n=1 Tax=Pleurodeles waltl TaxID=8319 RepID=A0AAV7URK9_PLEWA|nr:hypothetical protein NDU88_001011 [Pleurodeles waltl]